MITEVNVIGVYNVNQGESVHLIELTISTNHENVDISAFVQEQHGIDRLNWQTPWDEKFLDDGGTKIIGDWMNAPTNNSDFTRLVFFLHFVDFKKPLCTPFGKVELKTESEMPERLLHIIKYENP